MDMCQYAKILLEQYIQAESIEALGDLSEILDLDITVIGTGMYEVSETLPGFISTLSYENSLRERNRNVIESVWTKEQVISDDVRLVYGEVHVNVYTGDVEPPARMDMRNTLVFKREPVEFDEASCSEADWRKFGSVWKLVHIHQSTPNMDQMEGEFYPKTLIEQVDEANRRTKQLERMASTDGLTGLLNHGAFYNMSEELLGKGGGYCMAIDLDDFKSINDDHGHLVGDEVLREIGAILRDAIGDRGVAGRIGGDEFAIFSHGSIAEGDICAIAEDILSSAERLSRERIFPGLSIGISRVDEGETLRMAFRRADELLYKVKRSGKNGYRFRE